MSGLAGELRRVVSWQGRITRVGYLAWGVVLFALKYPCDLLVSQAYQQPWHPLMYLSPRVSPFGAAAPRAYLLTLLAVALPFVYLGVCLSARRLRDMGVHPFWAGLFFLPFVHFAFFLVLAVVPSSRVATDGVPGAGPYRGGSAPSDAVKGDALDGARVYLRGLPVKLFRVLIPQSEPLACLAGIFYSLVIGGGCLALCYSGSDGMKALGSVLFIGAPFGMGFSIAFCVGYKNPLSTMHAILWSFVPMGVAFILMLAIKWEGIACLVMAFPIVGGFSALGAVVGRGCAGTSPYHAPMLCVFLLPLMVALEVQHPQAPVPLSVVSEVRIAAPPEVVWRNVVSFPPIDAPPKPIFAIVAMPLEARIDGHDPGALRRCVFTNGTFEEPIEVWDEPRELRFGVHKQPNNLDDYVAITRGQFLLTPNADGSTTLRGTTWYRLKVFPTVYWHAWAQTFLHQIHLRVLEHIQKISEHPLSAPTTAAAIPLWMAASHATCACTMHH